MPHTATNDYLCGMNCIARTLYCMALAALAAACGHRDEPAPPPAPEPEPPAVAERTVLVYMVANNDLGQRGWDAADIAEMRTAAATGGLGQDGRLLVMHKSHEGKSVLKEINSRSAVDTLHVYADDTTPVSAVSIAGMQRAFDDMRRLAPAAHYGLVLWSHGTGWLQDGMPDDGRRRAFGLDGSAMMNVSSLAQALDGQDFEYVYFDCCHMASVEVAYELRHATPLIAASATELPNAGMPYDENIPLLMQGLPAEAAANTFRYYDSMSGSSRTCTMSVIATDGLDALAEATRTLYASASALPQGVMPQAFERGVCRHYDLDHYAELIAGSDEALARWREALRQVVLYADATPRIFNSLTIQRHCGLSTNVVRSADEMDLKGYAGLQWAADVASSLPWAR